MNLKLDNYIDKLGYEDLRNIARIPCPQSSLDKEIILISKRLRFSISLEEKEACAECPFRNECELADRSMDLSACSMSDLLKYLYAFYKRPTDLPSSIQSAISITEKLPSILSEISEDQAIPTLKVFNIDTDYISQVRRPKKPITKKKKLSKKLIWNPSPEEIQSKQNLQERLSQKSMVQEGVKRLISLSRVIK